MSRGVMVAAIQMQSTDDKQHNLVRALNLVDLAVQRGARLIALPEFFNFWGPSQRQRQEAETIPGPTVEALCRKALDCNVYILGGSIAERVNGKDKIFNSSVLVGPQGEVLAKYRKIHLFDVEIEGQMRVRESEVVQPGDGLVVAGTEYCTVGLTVCYDLRFPELYRGLTVKGARIIFVPSAFMASTGKDHWEPLLRARAIENQVFLVAPNEIGPIPGTALLRHGRSLIVDPWGTVLAQASDAEGVIVAELDFDYQDRVRRELPSLAHRRLPVA